MENSAVLCIFFVSFIWSASDCLEDAAVPSENERQESVEVPWNITKIHFENPILAEVQFVVGRNASVEYTHQIYIQMFSFLKDLGKEKSMEACGDVPYKVHLSDNDNFRVGELLDCVNSDIHRNHGCSGFYLHIRGKGGLQCNITIEYANPTSGNLISAHRRIATYHPLEIIHPIPVKGNRVWGGYPHVTLSIGSTFNLKVEGGPTVYDVRAESCNQVEMSDPDVIKVAEDNCRWATVDQSPASKLKINCYNVTCLSEGISDIIITDGILGNI